uniref:Uncharacterized protein n=1 Tax=Lygus hesperus TaxID=30085 RepID=A0A0A9YH57_LYGHE
MNGCVIFLCLATVAAAADYSDGLRMVATASRDLSTSVQTIKTLYERILHSVEVTIFREIPDTINQILNEIKTLLSKLYRNTVGRFVNVVRKSASRNLSEAHGSVSKIIQERTTALMKFFNETLPNLIRKTVEVIRQLIGQLYKDTIEKWFGNKRSLPSYQK